MNRATIRSLVFLSAPILFALAVITSGCNTLGSSVDDRLAWSGLPQPEERQTAALSNPLCLVLSPQEIAQVVGSTPTSIESFRSNGFKSSLCRFGFGPKNWIYVGVQPFPHSTDIPLWCDDRVSDYPNPPKHLPHCSQVRQELWIMVDSRAEDISKGQMAELLRIVVSRLPSP